MTIPTPAPAPAPTKKARPPRTVQLYRSGVTRRGFRWRLVAANGNILADSGEAYSRRIDALAGVASVTGTVLVSGTVLAGLDVDGTERRIPIVEVAR